MIYLDNNATTKIDPEVLAEMKPYLNEEYGNPGSRFYTLASNAYNAIEKSREQVAKLINAKPNEIIFTSSGSESNNFIVKGISDYLKNYEKKGNHLITSTVEHKSIINTFKYLNGEIYMNKEIKKNIEGDLNRIDRGYEVDLIDVDNNGLIDIENIESTIKANTILASFIWANNETGNINNIEEITKSLNKKGIFIHSDATQMVGKLPVDVNKVKVDALTFSSHKIYGPKGIAAAYLRSNKYTNKDITSLIHGGEEQEMGYRAGTQAVHNIVGFGKAAEIAKRDMDSNINKLKKLELGFIRILKKNFKDVIILTIDESVPGVVSFIIPCINNQIYLRKLSNRVAFSSGSACTISTKSNVLDSIGLGEYRNNFFRVAFGKNNSLEELYKLNEIFI